MNLVQAMRPEVFKALCDPNRIATVATLATKHGPSNVSDITEGCGIDFSGVRCGTLSSFGDVADYGEETVEELANYAVEPQA